MARVGVRSEINFFIVFIVVQCIIGCSFSGRCFIESINRPCEAVLTRMWENTFCRFVVRTSLGERLIAVDAACAAYERRPPGYGDATLRACYRCWNGKPAAFDETAGKERSMDDIAEEFIPTRKSLLDRLKNWGDDASWQDFFDIYWKLIYGVALKAGLTHSEAQDVVQDTVLAVAKSIGKFKYDPAVCAFKTWLLQVTRSKIANQFARRKQCPPQPDPVLDETSQTPLLERVPNPDGLGLEAIWDVEWQKNLMDAAITRVKRRMPIE